MSHPNTTDRNSAAGGQSELINMTRISFGSLVQQAVQESVLRQLPLLVALSREDTESESFVKNYLTTNARLETLESKFVALKLVENTEQAGQFAAIFPNLTYPSIYIISNGQLKLIVTMQITPDEFVNQLNGVCGNAELPKEEQEKGKATAAPKATAADVSEQNNTAGPLSVQRKLIATSPEHAKETERIRALIEADKRERKYISVPRGPTNDSASPKSTLLPGKCLLSIKLLDGTTVRQEFAVSETLNDVRHWLDNESGLVVLPDTSTVPSFAATSQHPTTYNFYSPAIPRITYSDTQEFSSLAELKLVPRSALILRPLFINVHGSYAHRESAPGSMWRDSGRAIKRLGHALFSFFDYGIDDALESLDDDAVSAGGHGSDMETSAYEDMHPPSQIGLEKREVPNLDSDATLSNERVILSRSLTPKLSSAPSMSRVQTVQGTGSELSLAADKDPQHDI